MSGMSELHIAMNAMARKGYFLIYGPPGGGKSFAAAKTFPNSLSILSAPNNQHFYYQWLQLPAGKASGKGLPKRVIVLDKYAMMDSGIPPGEFGSFTRPRIMVGPDQLPIPFPQKQTFEGLLMQVARKSLYERAAGLPLTYQNVIIDEGGALWQRIFIEISATSFTKEGRHNPLGAYNLGETWSVQCVDLFRAIVMAGLNVVVVAHDKDPEPEKDKQGGPKFFSQAVMKQMTADSDGNFYRYVEDQKPPVIDMTADPAVVAAAIAAAKRMPPKRLWRVYLSEHRESKLRGIPDEMMDQVREMDLEQIIPLSGFAP